MIETDKVYIVERIYDDRPYVESVWWTESTANAAMRQLAQTYEDHLRMVTGNPARSTPQPDGTVLVEQQTNDKNWVLAYKYRVVEHTVQGSAVDRLAEVAHD